MQTSEIDDELTRTNPWWRSPDSWEQQDVPPSCHLNQLSALGPGGGAGRQYQQPNCRQATGCASADLRGLPDSPRTGIGSETELAIKVVLHRSSAESPGSRARRRERPRSNGARRTAAGPGPPAATGKGDSGCRHQPRSPAVLPIQLGGGGRLHGGRISPAPVWNPNTSTTVGGTPSKPSPLPDSPPVSSSPVRACRSTTTGGRFRQGPSST